MKRQSGILLNLVSLGLLSGLTAAQSAPPQTQIPDPKLPLADPLHPIAVSPGAKELEELIRGRDLTLQDAVGIALATSRSYATSAANLERARGKTGEARSALSPQASIGGNITQYDQPTVANFGGAGFTIQNGFNPVFTTSISLPLDIFGAIHSAVSQAQFTEVAARIDVNRVRNQLIFDVKNAFYQALRAQGQLVVAQDTLNNGQMRLQDAQVMLRAGTGTQFDVLTAQRDVADAQQALVSSRGAVTLALARLKSVMGIDVSLPIGISDAGAVEEPLLGAPSAASPATPPPNSTDVKLPAGAATTPPPLDIKVPPPPELSDRLHRAQNEVELGEEYTRAVDEALTTRPEVLEANAEISAAERGVVYERRRGMPTVSLGASYVSQPNAAGFTRENQASVSLMFNIPLLEGGRVSSRVRQAKATVALAETDRRAAVDQVTLEVQQAYVNLVQARERVHVARVGVEQAREAFRLARVRARAGVTATPQASPQLELSNAQATLTQAETNQINALYDYNQARADLDRAIGRYSYGVGAGYTLPPTTKETGR